MEKHMVKNLKDYQYEWVPGGLALCLVNRPQQVVTDISQFRLENVSRLRL